MTKHKVHLSILLSSLFLVLPVKAIQPLVEPVANTLTSPVSSNPLLNRAQTLNQQGTDYLATGRADLALKYWQQAHQVYTQIKDEQGIIGTEINQAQALRSLGFYRQALLALRTTNTRLQNQPNSGLKVRGLFSIGNTLQSLGVLDKSAGDTDRDLWAVQVLNQALTIANALNDRQLADQIKLSLGNTLQTIGKEQLVRAIEIYQELRSSADPLVKIQAKVNLYRLGTTKLPAEIAKYQKIIDETDRDRQLEIRADAERKLSSLRFKELSPQQLLRDIKIEINGIPPTADTVYIHINLAKVVIDRLTRDRKPQQPIFTDRDLLIQVSQLLTTAIGQARTIKDSRGEAQALGSLGHLYELTSQHSEAQQLTEQARMIAENLPAPDIAYQLNWQLGRILTLTKPGNTSSAISAYNRAVSHLKSLRNDLNATDRDLQFSFRDQIEPVYRELVALLLKGEKTPPPDNLNTARDLIESLQVAEIEDFLHQGCLDKYTVQLDKIDRSAVVIYPIVLPDRIAVIASIPGQVEPKYYRSNKISAKEVEATINDLYTKIILSETDFDNEERLAFEQQSKRVYDLVLADLVKDLQQTNAKTLVFVLDGVLRNIPMSVLYDGKKYGSSVVGMRDR